MDCSLYLYIDGVPECDCDRYETKAACSVALLLEAAVSDLSESAEKGSPGEGVGSFTFVKTGMNASAEIDALQPGEHEQGSLHAAQLAEGNRESVLARVDAQFAEHERSDHGALLDGSGEMKDFIPVHPDRFEVDGAINPRYLYVKEAVTIRYDPRMLLSSCFTGSASSTVP